MFINIRSLLKLGEVKLRMSELKNLKYIQLIK